MKQLKARDSKGPVYLESTAKEAAREREKARVELESAKKREEVLRGVLRSQTSETLGQNVNAVEFGNLRVEISASRTLLETMLRKQAEMEVAARMAGTRESSARVVERASKPGVPLLPLRIGPISRRG